MIKGVIVTPLSIIEIADGDVLHGMKSSDQGYSGFGEAYFSTVKWGAIKGWKRHREMTMNLIVPAGSVRFVLYDDRQGSVSFNQFQQVIISKHKNYGRLTVPPMVWMGFQGLSIDGSMLLNIANIEHDPGEVDRLEIDKINYNWSIS